MVLYDLILWFFIYSIFGWCYETTFCSIEAGHFVERGFFYGPYLPIYGFGAIFLILLFHKKMNKLCLFFYSMLITTALEYFTSWILEVIFHKTWWNYTNYTIQLNGRICLVASILFGTLGVLLINYIQPLLKRLTDKLSKKLKIYLSSFGTILLLCDFIFSILKAFSA